MGISISVNIVLVLGSLRAEAPLLDFLVILSKGLTQISPPSLVELSPEEEKPVGFQSSEMAIIGLSGH
jgi:hypothetical protein